MAPPAKRRRISESSYTSSYSSEVPERPQGAPFSHGIEHLDATPTAQPPRLPSRIDEVHLEIRKRAAYEHGWLHRRQGTAAASDASTSSGDLLLSVGVSIGLDGSSTTSSTASMIAYGTDVPASSASSTTTSTTSEESSTILSGTVSSAESTSNGTETTSSTDSSSSTTDSVTSTPTGSEGLIGITASGGTAPTSSASSSISSDSSSTNGTMTPSDSITLVAGTVSGYTAQTVLTSSSNKLNFTTSSTIISASDSTYTSQSVFNIAALTSTSSGSQTSSSASSSSSFDAGVIFLATLDDGRVATITRSDRPYSTRLDGTPTTISPIPSTTSGSSRSRTSTSPDDESTPSSAFSSAVSTISTGPATARSTVFSTYTPSYTTDASGSTVTVAVGAAGVGGQGTAVSSSASSTSSASSDSGSGSGASDPAPAGTIAGGVVGGAAGLAVILLVAMLFLRWWRRRASGTHQALPANSAGAGALSPDIDAAPVSRSGAPGMAERAGLMPAFGAMPAFMRHQARQPAAGTGERGFTRVSGRKLPSAFSEGMVGPSAAAMGTNNMRGTASPPPNMPLVAGGRPSESDHERNMSNQSFYRDSAGFYGGTGDANAVPSTTPDSRNPFSDLTPIDTDITPGSDVDGAREPIISPGPQRRPTVHQGGPYVMRSADGGDGVGRGMLSPEPPASSGNMSGSWDGSRGSRFLEEV